MTDFNPTVTILLTEYDELRNSKKQMQKQYDALKEDVQSITGSLDLEKIAKDAEQKRGGPRTGKVGPVSGKTA